MGKPGVFTDRSVLDGDGQVLAVAVVGVDFRAECAYPGTMTWLSTGDVMTTAATPQSEAGGASVDRDDAGRVGVLGVDPDAPVR